MSGTFIYGLWGSPELAPRRPKILEEIEWWLQTKHRPTPWEIYVYGENNQDWLAERGVPCTMLHPDPLVDFHHVGGPPEPWGKGQMVWGKCSIWRHKTGIIESAINRHGTVVWLDWDTVMVKPLPEGFWQRMAEGQPIQMSLVQYRRRQCGWRRKGSRQVPVGGLSYCRDRRIMSRVNRTYAKHRGEIDQTIFARVMDEMAGGWPGADGYKTMGFEPYCHYGYAQIHRPKTVVFKTGGRITLERWEDEHATQPE